MLKLFSSIYKRNFASFKKILSELYNIKSAPLLKGSRDMMVISLEDRLLAALYPSPPIHFLYADTIERGTNAVGMIMSPPAAE